MWLNCILLSTKKAVSPFGTGFSPICLTRTQVTLGFSACFSFHVAKNITAGTGGALATNDSAGDWLQPKDSLFGTTAIIGDGAALLSSVFYAGSFLLVEKLRQRLTTSNILVWRCTIGLAIAAPLVWTIDDSIFPLSTTGWIAVIGLAVFSEVIGHGLVVYSLKYFSSAFVTIVLLLEPAPAAGIAWVLFGEFLDPLNIVGFILITLGIYLAKTGAGSDGGDKQNPPSPVQQELVQANIEP